jgi:probable F420-dependent oxidoreductase
MNIGLVFPQTEFGSDPAAIRGYAQTAEGLGYSHVLAYDHVLGMHPTPDNARRNDWQDGVWRGPYSHEHAFHEPFVLFGFMAAVTQRLGFATGILVLPQRNAVVTAKQAAALDVLSGGRLRLGVGVGWNKAEMANIGENPANRGARLDEQLAVMRLLWTSERAAFTGRWHTLTDASLSPLPVQRPIPLWFGGHAPEVMRRVAQWGGGWMPGFRQGDQAREWLAGLDAALAAAGRTREAIGIEPRLSWGDGDPEKWRATLAGWQAVGATHISLNTMGLGFTSPDQHIVAMERFAREMNIHLHPQV